MRKIIYLAGGCFWGVEAYYKLVEGVIDTEVGYANGNIPNPTYEDVKRHKSTASETVKIEYEDSLVTLEDLLSHYLRFIEPYSIDKQGNDIGHQYRAGVYSDDPNDLKRAKTFFDEKLRPGYTIEVLPLDNFYKAEDYHQDYLDKNPHGYCHIDLRLAKNSLSILMTITCPLVSQKYCTPIFRSSIFRTVI